MRFDTTEDVLLTIDGVVALLCRALNDGLVPLVNTVPGVRVSTVLVLDVGCRKIDAFLSGVEENFVTIELTEVVVVVCVEVTLLDGANPEEQVSENWPEEPPPKGVLLN